MLGIFLGWAREKLLIMSTDNYSLCGNLTYFMAARGLLSRKKAVLPNLKTRCLDSFPN